MAIDHEFVWVFLGEGARFPGAVFSDVETASAWISKHSLTGVLTKYPMDAGAYDWAIATRLFVPKKPEQSLPKFIGSFTSASMEHFHCENGVLE